MSQGATDIKWRLSSFAPATPAVADPVGIRTRSSLSTAKLVLNAQTFGYRVRNARMDGAASWRDDWDASLGFDQIGRWLKRCLLRQREMAA